MLWAGSAGLLPGQGLQQTNSDYPTIEVEVEMNRGSSANLLLPADGLDRVEVRGAPTKSGRSDALVGGEEPSSFKAEQIELKPEMPAVGAMAKSW